MKNKNQKRLIAEIDEESFNIFKAKCKAIGASMSEVILLGLEAGLEKYVQKEIEKIEIQKKQYRDFCNNLKLGDLKWAKYNLLTLKKKN